MVEVWVGWVIEGVGLKTYPLSTGNGIPARDRSIADLARRLASLSRAHDHGVHHAVRRSR